jgi:hypothetical protein
LNARRSPSALPPSFERSRSPLTIPKTTSALERPALHPSEKAEAPSQLVLRQGSCQRSLSLFVLVGILLLEVGRDRLHDLLGLALVIDGVSVQVFGRAELQLGDASLSILLDCDLIGLGEVLLLPPHHLDELFQIFDFLGLQKTNIDLVKYSLKLTRGATKQSTYHSVPCSFNKYNFIPGYL